VGAAASCPCCGAGAPAEFHRADGIPVSSCVLVGTREEALAFPRRDLRLGFCARCGFITNTVFDPAAQALSDKYEETQGFSPTFGAFARGLATKLIERWDLAGKRALEVGCGKGEFLELLCELGMAGGTGIDPCWAPGRARPELADRARFLRETYSAQRHGALTGDLVVCRHTLEHIAQPAAFLRELRAGIGARSDAVVVFEVPDVARVLREGAFWDVYYEHCSYFAPAALEAVFAASGFRVEDLWTEYDGQYLLLAARPADGPQAPRRPLQEDVAELQGLVQSFRRAAAAAIARWREVVARPPGRGRGTVIWGAGSKGVAFLTTLGAGDAVAAAVDVNPFKQGQFMPGTGQEVLAPEALRAVQPGRVIVMNPVYVREIGAQLRALGVEAELLAV